MTNQINAIPSTRVEQVEGEICKCLTTLNEEITIQTAELIHLIEKLDDTLSSDFDREMPTESIKIEPMTCRLSSALHELYVRVSTNNNCLKRIINNCQL